MEHNNHMYYESPAKMWKDALPLGNGRLGAMVYGETDMERIPLNDDGGSSQLSASLYLHWTAEYGAEPEDALCHGWKTQISGSGSLSYGFGFDVGNSHSGPQDGEYFL